MEASTGSAGSPAGEILREWEARCERLAGAGTPFPRGIRAQAALLLEEVLRWLESGDQEPDTSLRAAFGDLTRIFRHHGVTTSSALRSLALLEDVLGESDLVPRSDGSPGTMGRLRLGLRGMLLDAVQLNTDLDARISRERADALEFFSEVLGHEIGNRLGASQTAVELLRTGEVEITAERRAALLDLIYEGVQSALTSVEDVTALMLAQARQESGERSFARVAREVVRMISPVARKEGVRVDVADDPPDVRVDSARIRLILTNLALNGVRYSDPAREERWVRITGETAAGGLLIKVADNGIGIAPEEQEEVFRYRERGTEGQARSHAGSGLGLAVVAEAASQMGAELALDSEPGRGTTFILSVPGAG